MRSSTGWPSLSLKPLGGRQPSTSIFSATRTTRYGPDFFTFTVSDGALTSQPARVEITIRPVNDPPRLEARGKTAVLTGELGALEIITTDVEQGTVKVTPGSLPISTLFTPGASARAPNYFSWLRNTGYSTFSNETFTSVAAGGNAFWVGTNPYGVFVSRAAGATWLPANSGLQLPLNVRELWVRGDYLFAASVRFDPPYGGNVFVRRLANN